MPMCDASFLWRRGKTDGAHLTSTNQPRAGFFSKRSAPGCRFVTSLLVDSHAVAMLPNPVQVVVALLKGALPMN
jgi:hypothetical protein